MKVLMLFNDFLKKLGKLDFLGLLSLRVYLFFIFWSAGTYHLEDFKMFSEYLEGLDIPFPDILSYLVITIEAGGAVFLLIGLFVRWVSIPMICLMLFAILMVHLENGWSNENNGIEFAVTYILMLFILLFSGGGKFLSLDFWVSKNK